MTDDAITFIRRTALKGRPQGIGEARSLLSALSDYVIFLIERGVSLRPASPLDRVFDDNKLSAWERDLMRRVEAKAATQGTSNSRVSTIRVLLERLEDAIEHGEFLMSSGRMSRASLTPPMSDHDFLRWLQVADAQPDALRLRMRVLLIACRAAGLGSSDLQMLRGSDVVRRRDGQVVIAVRGRYGRTVEVLDRWAEELHAHAQVFGDTLIAGTWVYRVNPAYDLIHSVRGGRGLTRTQLVRSLRRAYVIEVLHTDTNPLVLQQQLGAESLSEIEGALQFVDPTVLDRSGLRHGAPTSLEASA